MEHARPPQELCLEGNSVSRADAWKRWKMQFELFLKASGVQKEKGDVQASLLINLIGPEGFEIYETFKFEKESERDDVKILMEKFDNYFGVKNNIILARYNFFKRNQEVAETINQYVTSLRILAKKCDFRDLENELIRDRVVCGIKSSIVRDRLLRHEELTLDSAVKICQVQEISNDNIRLLENPCTSKGSAQVEINAVRVRDNGGSRGRCRGVPWRRGRSWASPAAPARFVRRLPDLPCERCGGNCTDPASCPALITKCYNCQNKGHLAKMCQLKKNDGYNKMYDIAVCNDLKSDEEVSDHESPFVISMLRISELNVSSEGWFVTLRGECGSEKFKLDTGADINVLSYARFISLGYNTDIINMKHNIRLQSYSGNLIPLRGICFLMFYYKNVPYNLKFAIANINCQSVLGRQSCLDLQLIKRIHDIKCENVDLFDGLGCLPGEYHIVIDKSVPPVVCASRKIPLGLKSKLCDELNRMVELGVIQKVNHPTPWVNSLVVVAKKNGQLRICLDPRPLNKAIQRAHFQLPTINEFATKLYGAKYFSVLDAFSGFWAIKLDKESADLCTFNTPFGRYQYLRLPFGLNCASEIFHAKMKQLLEGLEGVESFIDDIICWGQTKTEHDERLKALFNRAREINLKFNKEKCKIGVEEVIYLGHCFNQNGMSPDPEKIKAIKDMSEPNDRKSLERFLGAVNYLSKFIPNYSENIYVLTRLLRKDISWSWEQGHRCAFEKLKDLLCNAPVLALYDVSGPVIISVDASSVALGAVLLQEGRPIEYASRTLTETQVRYAQIEKEMLAIVFACEKFHQYIYGKQRVLIESDHKPLESIFKKSLDSIPARLQRMILKLQGYDLYVTYKPGKLMFLPDTLSRAPLPDLYDDKISKAVLYQLEMVINNIPISKKVNVS